MYESMTSTWALLHCAIAIGFQVRVVLQRLLWACRVSFYVVDETDPFSTFTFILLIPLGYFFLPPGANPAAQWRLWNFKNKKTWRKEVKLVCKTVKNFLRMLFLFSKEGIHFYWPKIKICNLLQMYMIHELWLGSYCSVGERLSHPENEGLQIQPILQLWENEIHVQTLGFLFCKTG